MPIHYAGSRKEDDSRRRIPNPVYSFQFKAGISASVTPQDQSIVKPGCQKRFWVSFDPPSCCEVDAPTILRMNSAVSGLKHIYQRVVGHPSSLHEEWVT
uniref:Uncharacterized protein n=1 Tax=Panagrellus redivivus TaxID=6233 RepID=A0A7E4V7T5_PANRE